MSHLGNIRFLIRPLDTEWRAKKLSQYEVITLEATATDGDIDGWPECCEVFHQLEFGRVKLPPEVDKLADDELAWVTAEVHDELVDGGFDYPSERIHSLVNAKLQHIEKDRPLQ